MYVLLFSRRFKIRTRAIPTAQLRAVNGVTWVPSPCLPVQRDDVVVWIGLLVAYVVGHAQAYW